MVKVYTSCQNELKFLPSAAVQQCLVSFKRQNMIKTNYRYINIVWFIFNSNGRKGLKGHQSQNGNKNNFFCIVTPCGVLRVKR